MSQIRVADAARNNAAWCDAVCSAHGHPGELSDSHWLNRAPAPPFYPNLVTLDRAPGPALAAVQELEAAPPSASWAVKDSFAVLPLERAGFRLLLRRRVDRSPRGARGSAVSRGSLRPGRLRVGARVLRSSVGRERREAAGLPPGPPAPE